MMHCPGEKFVSDTYLVIKNEYLQAPTEMSVSRDDLMSVLQHFNSIEKYRFQDQDEHIHWTKAYAKFKDRNCAAQAKKILASVNYISVEHLTRVLHQYDVLEDQLRSTNPTCDHGTCVVIEPMCVNFSYENLFNKFCNYGPILHFMQFSNHVMIWYQKATEAFAAEIDNNKWSNSPNYFTVKIYEQMKELTLRMLSISANNYEDPFEEEDNTFPNDSRVNTAFSGMKLNIPNTSSSEISNEAVSEQSEDANTLTSIETTLQTPESSTRPQNMRFNLNDYTYYLQIVKKNQSSPTKNNLNLASGISIELSAQDLSGFGATLGPDIHAEIQESLNSKLKDLKVDDSESEDFLPHESNPFSFRSDSQDFEDNLSTLESSFSDLNDNRPLNGNDGKQKSEPIDIPQNRKKYLEKSNTPPFYHYALPQIPNYYMNHMSFYENSLYGDPLNSYSCPCCGSLIPNVSPWSVVPNVFIVPTTNFGNYRRSMQRNYEMSSPDTNATTASTSINVPEFDETNFPPLGSELPKKQTTKKPKSSVFLSKKTEMSKGEKEFKERNFLKITPDLKKSKSKKSPKSPQINFYNSDFISKSRIRKKRTPKQSQNQTPENKTSNNHAIYRNPSYEDKNVILKPRSQRRLDFHRSGKSDTLKLSSMKNALNSGFDAKKMHKNKEP